ncbi:MAG: TlpA family protein disulfide reductase [Phycisphaerales bacterium]|nr:TlpA family protein disulfide reductase [Phycisphaerales bacterium]
MKKLISAVVLAAVCAGAPLCLGDVVREGSGARRTALNAMELKPFPSEIWSKLSDWSGGKALASSDTSGQVVLICTWSGWYPPSTRALSVAKRLAEEKAKDGLVVVAVHHPDGWKEAEKPQAAEGAKLFIALDEKSEFRKALMVDQDPDFYLIDRAGQLRYADIATESVNEAVRTLLAETQEKAAGLTGEIAAAKAKQDEEFRKTGNIRQGVDIRAMPEVPFTEPQPEVYGRAGWPRVEKSQNSYEQSTGQLITLPEEGWFPAKPKVKGRVMVIYVFSPFIRKSYEDIIPAMDQLQRQHGRDMAVVGSVAPIRPDNQQNAEGQDPAALTTLAKSFATSRTLDHSILADGGSAAGFSGSGQNTLPWVVIASSDGVVRWSGSPNSPSFRAAVDQVLRADPGVKSRREAEEKYIREKK